MRADVKKIYGEFFSLERHYLDIKLPLPWITPTDNGSLYLRINGFAAKRRELTNFYGLLACSENFFSDANSIENSRESGIRNALYKSFNYLVRSNADV